MLEGAFDAGTHPFFVYETGEYFFDVVVAVDKVGYGDDPRIAERVHEVVIPVDDGPGHGLRFLEPRGNLEIVVFADHEDLESS